ncbi:MAG: cytochrome c peroxidase [Puia sp.]|nr:cytochrome c peroxidase [Puia sp.]
MKKVSIIIATIGCLVAVPGLEAPPPGSIGVDPAIACFKNGSREFASSALKLEKAIGAISKTDTQSVGQAKMALADCRLCYKKIEFFLEYFFRSASTVYNLPPKAEVEEPYMEYADPTGLQVIESLLFAKDVFEQKEALLQQASLVGNSALDLGSLLYDFKADDRQVLESLRFELIRVMTLGITGFDAPALKGGIRESAVAIRSMGEILRPYLEKKGPTGMSPVSVAGTSAEKHGVTRKVYSPGDSVGFYLRRSLFLLERSGGRDSVRGGDFDSFDRMAFLTEAALPLQQWLGEWIHSIGMDLNTDPVLNPRARNLFSPDAFDLGAFPHAGEGDFSPGNTLLYGSASYLQTGVGAGTRDPDENSAARRINPLLIELGRRLFFEKALSGNHTRNCAGCHQPEKYFTDGMARSIAYDGHSMVKRNAPTLLYAAYQYNQFLDGRVRTLEDQVKDVLHNPIEMNANYDTVCRRLQRRPDYAGLFARAFPDSVAVTARDGSPARQRSPDRDSTGRTSAGRASIDRIAVAIATFVRTLAPRNSGFDRYLAGDKKAMTAAQIRGFNLFMGKGQCGTCHFAPLFNGLTPPLYGRSEFEVLGVPATDDFSHVTADRDSGRYTVFPISFYQGAFRIPGLRNVAVTAPYMHQGSFRTLEKVVEFYNRGGGAGLGMDVPLQTLSSTPLGLTDREKKEIVDFLHALTDRLPVKS